MRKKQLPPRHPPAGGCHPSSPGGETINNTILFFEGETGDKMFNDRLYPVGY